MKKLAIFIRGGIGDRYPFFSTIPSILKKFKVNVNELLVMVDSPYRNRSSAEYATENVMLEAIGISDVVVTMKSDRGNIGYTQYESENGFDGDELSDKSFLPYRGPKITKFVSDLMKEHKIEQMLDFLYVEQILHWNGTKNTRLYDLERTPFSFIPKNKFNRWDVDNTVLVHCTPSGYRHIPIWDEVNIYAEAINSLPHLNFVLVGHHIDGFKPAKNIIDLRGKLNPKELFDGILYTKNALMTGANFAFHRLLSDKNSVFIWPYKLANPKTIFASEYFDRDKMKFINSNKPININNIINSLDRV